MNTFHSRTCCINIVRDAEGHALSTPLLPEGDESGLRDLPDDGRQVLLVAAAVARRRCLGVSAVTAADHRLTLEETEVEVC